MEISAAPRSAYTPISALPFAIPIIRAIPISLQFKGGMAREHRLKSVFPPGFDGLSSGSRGTSGHYTHSTEQLYIALVEACNPMANAELITVKSAWYGKQTDSAEHEYILIQVEDAGGDEDNKEVSKEGGNKAVINYLVLDRNVANKPVRSVKAFGHSQTSVQGGKASDTFRVSYDGDVERLLEDCNLQSSSRRFIEHIQFPSDQPLHLYELVTLADVVSTQYPNYQAMGSNCFLFAGLIWDSLCMLYPSAIRDKSLEKERGKYGWLRYAPEKSQVKETSKQAKEKIAHAKWKIETQKVLLEKHLEKLIHSRIIAMGKTAAIPGQAAAI